MQKNTFKITELLDRYSPDGQWSITYYYEGLPRDVNKKMYATEIQKLISKNATFKIFEMLPRYLRGRVPHERFMMLKVKIVICNNGTFWRKFTQPFTFSPYMTVGSFG
jgi:hypothetical protein